MQFNHLQTNGEYLLNQNTGPEPFLAAPTPIRLKLPTTWQGSSRMAECSHDNLGPDGACMACGIVCQSFYSHGNDHGYTSNHSIPRHNDRSILKELEELRLPDDIKARADQIYQEMENGTRRGTRRKQLVFYCTYQAYHDGGYRKDPYEIARLVGIATGDVTKAISTYSDRRVGAKKVTEYSPVEFIPQYCEALNLAHECKQKILTFAAGILRKDPDLLDRTPRAVAAGIIMYYLTVIAGAVVDVKQFAKSVLMSEVTVNKSCKSIMEVDNR